MYRLALTTAIFCTLLLQFAPATAHARGEFSRTCSDIKYKDGILYANCQMAISKSRVESTSIDLSSLMFWKKDSGCLQNFSDNCFYLAWGRPAYHQFDDKADLYFSGFSNSYYHPRLFTDLQYWLNGTTSPVTLHGRGCYKGVLGKWACCDSNIDLDEHIKNNNGTLEYIP